MKSTVTVNGQPAQPQLEVLHTLTKACDQNGTYVALHHSVNFLNQCILTILVYSQVVAEKADGAGCRVITGNEEHHCLGQNLIFCQTCKIQVTILSCIWRGNLKPGQSHVIMQSAFSEAIESQFQFRLYS